MNRLIAFLRDSYREAISGWMLQVMLLFAVVLIAFISSISSSAPGSRAHFPK